MRHFIIAVASAAIAAAGVASARANEIRPLEVTPGKGAAPLGVVLTGPPAFVSQAHDFIANHGACSVPSGRGVRLFTIDWGDDPARSASWPHTQNPDCRLTHTYAAPGTYTIRAGFFQPGASESPVPDWVGETKLTVSAP